MIFTAGLGSGDGAIGEVDGVSSAVAVGVGLSGGATDGVGLAAAGLAEPVDGDTAGEAEGVV